MSRRCFALTPLFLLVVVGSARAHALRGDYTILPGKKIRIECWFAKSLTSEDEVPKAAGVQVLRSDGSVIVEGTTDSQGAFVFTYEQPQTMTVIVDAGAGHRVTLTIKEEKLGKTGEVGAADPQTETDPNRTHRHDESSLWGPVLLGVGVLLVPAAVVLGVRKWRQRQTARADTR
jgi:hypothetical protein